MSDVRATSGVRAKLRAILSPAAVRHRFHQTRTAAITRFNTRWPAGIAWHVLITAGASLVGLALLAKIGEDVFNHQTGSFDDAVRTWTLHHRARLGYEVFLWIARLGAPGPVVAIAIAITVWLWRARGRRVAGGLIFAPTSAVALFDIMKFAFARKRPAGAAAAGIGTYAFPSGHATTSAAVIATVVYILWREQFMNGRAAVAIAVSVPLLIGISRVYLDVHWATDVLGGWAIGVFVFGLTAAAYERQRRRLDIQSTQPPQYPTHSRRP